MNETRPILTITGSDSTSGSGVQADIRTISELGGWAVSAVTSITVQTTLGIQEFYDLPADIVAGQIEAVMNDVAPQVVKIGMVRRPDVVEVVVRMLERYRPRHVVYHPLLRSARGEALMDDALAACIERRLLPLCTLVVRHDATDLHGLSGSYASAVAFYLSQDLPQQEAVARARAYIDMLMVRSGRLQGRGNELFRDFLVAVDQHVRQNSDVHFYADRLNVSSRYLAQVTRRIGGKSPKAIIDERLMQEIVDRLTGTQKSIQQIAYDCGFTSQAHFTKYFKKQKGMSPSQWRKLQ